MRIHKFNYEINGYYRQDGACTVLDLLDECCLYLESMVKTIENDDLKLGFKMAIASFKVFIQTFLLEVKHTRDDQ